MSEPLLDRAGRRRSPATLPGFHSGHAPGKGLRYPADPPKVEEIVAVMRTAGDGAHGRRLRGYHYSFDVAAGEGESPYYCVFEADFDDAAALTAAQESPEGQAVRADVPNYATGGVVVLNYEVRSG